MKKMTNPCWKGYKAVGFKMKNGKRVPNCVPMEETLKTFREFLEEEGESGVPVNNAGTPGIAGIFPPEALIRRKSQVKYIRRNKKKAS